MKKKVVAMIMTGIILSLSACGFESSDKDTAVLEDAQETEESRVMTSTSTGTNRQDEILRPVEPSMEIVPPSDKAEQTPKPAEQSPEPESLPQMKEEYLQITREPVYDSCFEGTYIMYGHYNTLKLESTGYPELTKAVNSHNALQVNAMQDGMERLKEWGLEEYREYGEESFRGPYVLENDTYIRRADSKVLSVVDMVYEYAGGAHGNEYYGTVNIDVATGEDLALEDVIVDLNALPAILETELREKYPEVEYWSDSLYSMLMDYVNPTSEEYQPDFTWTLDYEGVTIYFSDYEISSYVDGTQQVTLTYSEYPEVFNMDFFGGETQKNYVLELPDSWRVSDVDLYNDGKTDYITVYQNYTGEEDFCDSFAVRVNENTFTLDTYCYELDTYLVKSDGKYYLYIQRTAENDYKTVCVFEITDCSVEFVKEFAGGMEMFLQSKDFSVKKRFDILSTYNGIAKCYLGEDGLPVEYDSVYKVDGDMILTSIADITVDLIDEQGNLLGSTYTFPAGTTYRLIATDGSSTVDVEMSDGQKGRFFVDPGWPLTVNGINAEELFEMLYFAG